MKDRFTHKSSSQRRRIRRDTRLIVYSRDGHTCQYCGVRQEQEKLTIDHVIPLALGGDDQITNYVTACVDCNQKKRDLPLSEFARQINRDDMVLPVHGDPVIQNDAIPEELRKLRARIFAIGRTGRLRITGRSGQQRLEKAFRREFWQTPIGVDLARTFPTLPGHARVMIPEIRAIASSEREAILLLELSKSANTRNLIGSVLRKGMPIERVVRDMAEKESNPAMRKRLADAMKRFVKAMAKKHLPNILR